MSEILSEVVETTVQETRMVTGIECDICNKVIPVAEYNADGSKYFRVTTGHHEWGNDSCESVEYHDICPDCINKFVTEYLQDNENSAYINIDTEFAYPYRRIKK